MRLPTITEAFAEGFLKNLVAVKIKHTPETGLLDESVRFYLPIDYVGNTVHPTKARSFECWAYSSDATRTVPLKIDKMNLGLVKHSDENYFGTLINAVKSLNRDKVSTWLSGLIRKPCDDIMLFNFMIVE